MKTRVNWIIDGSIEVEAENASDAEQIVADKLQHFIQSHPALTNHFQKEQDIAELNEHE